MASDAFSELPTASLCHLKRCADYVRQALARDIGRHYEALTGLQLHLRRGTGPGSWCPAAERRLVRNPAIPQRCAHCAEDIWQVATREKADGQVFSGACGRQNCWLSIGAADGCALSLVIQTAEPQAAVRRASGVALKPATNRAEARDPAQAGPATDQASCQAGMDCLPGGDGFGQAVTLLKLVASGYASAGWFRHSFKHHVGLSPSDWRRSHHQS